MNQTMTGIDNFPDDEIIKTVAEAPATVINLGKYADTDLVTKQELCKAFSCSGRTLQRMVERYEIPPPTSLAGRKVWLVGKVKAWIADAADRREADAIREARRLKVFNA